MKFLIVIYFFSFGCTVQKHRTKSLSKQDSTAIKEWEEKNRLLLLENSGLREENRVLQYSGILFDTTEKARPIFNIPPDCNTDSLRAVLQSQGNTIRILKDGTIEAKGSIKAAYSNRDENKIRESYLQRKIDSLTEVKQKEHIVVQTRIQEIETQKKVSGLILWLLVAAAGGFILRGYIKLTG